MFYVYVIELDPEFGLTRKAKETNPNRNPEMPCIYIGQSSKPPERRFKEHINGKRNANGHPLFSRIVKKHGIRLLPQMYEEYNPIRLRDDAKDMEKYLAEKYRKKGYTVWWN